ncbi:MAG: carboxypeptidase-like regulatory domain-containing protein [Thermoplasmatota archaeon]
MRRVALLMVLLAGCQTIVPQPSLVVDVLAPQRGALGPLAGAEVALSDGIHGGVTGAAGEVSMYGIPAGAYNVSISFADQLAHRRVAVTNETSRLSVTLNETGRPEILVSVTSCPSACAPAVGAIVLLSDNVHGGRTGATGEFGFFGLPEGAYNVTVQWQGSSQKQPAQVESGPLPVELAFRFA